MSRTQSAERLENGAQEGRLTVLLQNQIALKIAPTSKSTANFTGVARSRITKGQTLEKQTCATADWVFGVKVTKLTALQYPLKGKGDNKKLLLATKIDRVTSITSRRLVPSTTPGEKRSAALD